MESDTSDFRLRQLQQLEREFVLWVFPKKFSRQPNRMVACIFKGGQRIRIVDMFQDDQREVLQLLVGRPSDSEQEERPLLYGLLQSREFGTKEKHQEQRNRHGQERIRYILVVPFDVHRNFLWRMDTHSFAGRTPGFVPRTA